jgi:alpha-amylase
VGELNVPQILTWADTDRDLTAWVGNKMQQSAIQGIYALEDEIKLLDDDLILNDWRLLQTSDHFYYMCTKWFSDGDVHAYFSPYESPYEAFISYMNALKDLNLRVKKAHLNQEKLHHIQEVHTMVVSQPDLDHIMDRIYKFVN